MPLAGLALTTFQLLCLAALAIAYTFSVADACRARVPERRVGARGRAREVLWLAAAAALAEHTVIEAYGFYTYADGWVGRLGHVPALVAVIWPMVVLSARALVSRLAPHWRGAPRAAAVAGLVVLDASLMEVLAVDAGYWRWHVPGYLGIPIVGITGWGAFAFAASLWLDHPRLSPSRGPALGRLSGLLATLVATHGVLLALWWAALRWVLRSPDPTGDRWPLAAAGAAWAATWILRARRRAAPDSEASEGMGWENALPRLVATAVFLTLAIARPADREGALPVWRHVALVAVPYLLAMPPLRRRPSGIDRPTTSRER